MYDRFGLKSVREIESASLVRKGGRKHQIAGMFPINIAGNSIAHREIDQIGQLDRQNAKAGTCHHISNPMAVIMKT